MHRSCRRRVQPSQSQQERTQPDLLLEEGDDKNRLVIRDGIATAIICDKIQSMISNRRGRKQSLRGVVIGRKKLDLVLVGILQDLLSSQDSWREIELYIYDDERKNKRILRLLQALFMNMINSSGGFIERLILFRPTQSIISWLGGIALKRQEQRPPTIKTIHALSIRNATITPVIATSLSEGLKSPRCTLKKLDFSNSNFSGSEASSILGIALKACPSIEELCLSYCHLEDEEIYNLLWPLTQDDDRNATSNLTSLILDGNFCQEQGTIAVSRLLSTLTRLNLSNQNVWDNREYLTPLFQALTSKAKCTLAELDVSANFLQDNHLELLLQVLEENDGILKHINLTNNRITDDGIKTFSTRLPNLKIKSMNLGQNSFTKIQCLQQGMEQNVYITDLVLDINLTTLLLYYLALNKGGRKTKQLEETDRLPLSIWPLILERCSSVCCFTEDLIDNGIRPEDIVFDLLHGPVLLER